MSQASINDRDFSPEWNFTSSKSSGPGGQNVNKVNTRIELRFDINKSKLLSGPEKEAILKMPGNKINQAGELIIVSQSSRSQLKNKEECITKFYRLLAKALEKPRPRKTTVPTRSSIAKRLESKKHLSEKKRLRKKGDY
ncbi:Hypothetical protein YaeJ with similarity to translation release factor [hydrothermal vent metagenome]|uniref:Prokaryotic-type class I peptide chain release factors domain-containing protein n=1 Tax=hydrothermal vent metagenome TaxID=652676 RepID=A0A3B0TTJ4_9ZZZZ